MNSTTIDTRLGHARQNGTLVGFVLNRAKEGIDIRPLLTDEEIVQVNVACEQRLQIAKEEEARRRAEEASRLLKQKQHEEWCATLPRIGIKVATFLSQTRESKVGRLYSDLRRYGISVHKYRKRYWITNEDTQRYLSLQSCKSKTAWDQCGRALTSNAKPVGYRFNRYGAVALYSEDQTRPKRKQAPGVVQPTDDAASLLAAIFSVNRSAKRYRDAASSCYGAAKWHDIGGRASCHALAGINSKKKERLYLLKDAGVIHAVCQGWLKPVAKHGSFTVYQGYGYCFHSLLCPIGWTAAEPREGEVFVEQKPRSTSEMRLKDAVATLESLSIESEGFEKAELPKRAEPSRAESFEVEECDDFESDDDGMYFDGDDEFEE